jgi:ABC-type glycerol-3-phosphate transport system permease component
VNRADRVASKARVVATILVATMFFMPLWWVTISAFRPEDDIFRYLSPLGMQTLLPAEWTLRSIVELWQSDFARAIFNSMLVAVLTVVVGLVVCATAAFALAVVEFPGRNVVFAVMVISFLIPFDAIALPLYEIMRGFGLQNTYVGLVLPGVGNGLAVFLLRQFFLGLPRELRDAGTIDGLGWFGLFRRIYLPLSVPALISAAIILFVFQWHAYLWPLLIAPAPAYKVAAVSIAQFSTTYDVRYGLMFAGSFFLSVVPMVVLVGFQQFFAESTAHSGSKD